jgi:cysteinyl-tRNA synthetase
MDDDLNTADAIGALFSLVQDANVSLSEHSAKEAIKGALDTLLSLCDVLGILAQNMDDELPKDIQALVDQRAQARKDREWKLSDTLRDELKDRGYIVEDTAKGQKVRKTV